MSTLRYAVPNVLTALSLLLALCSIVASELGALELAAWLIVWCVLLDVVDGVTARLLEATSKFGAEFDSLTDLVAFGIAPAILVLHAGQQVGGIEFATGLYWWLGSACAVYVVLSAARLARFNSKPSQRAGWFRGIPTTMCGALIATSMILVTRHAAGSAFAWPALLAPLMLLLGLAMISNLWFPKIRPARNPLLNALHLANVVGIYVCGILRIVPEYLFGAALMFLIMGVAAGRRKAVDD